MTILRDLNRNNLKITRRMKHKSFIFLLLGMVVILTSMSKCDFDLNPWRIEHSYITAELNGEPYASTAAESYGGAARLSPTLQASSRDSYFSFYVWRVLYSGEKYMTLNIDRYECHSKLELNKKYDLMAGEIPEQGGMSIYSDCGEFYLTEGSVMFTWYEDTEHFAGKFEFTAYCPELDSTIVATNGTFEFDGTEKRTSRYEDR